MKNTKENSDFIRFLIILKKCYTFPGIGGIMNSIFRKYKGKTGPENHESWRYGLYENE